MKGHTISNSKIIKNLYYLLKSDLNVLITLEKTQTFTLAELQHWIHALRHLDMGCPCRTFGYDIQNCPFYHCTEIYEDCDENCKDCDIDCNVCVRTALWVHISMNVKDLEKLHNTGMWAFLTCLCLAQQLEFLLYEKIRLDYMPSLKVGEA